MKKVCNRCRAGKHGRCDIVGEDKAQGCECGRIDCAEGRVRRILRRQSPFNGMFNVVTAGKALHLALRRSAS